MSHISETKVLRQFEEGNGLNIGSLHFPGEGDFTKTWLVNEQIVVRCARHAEAEAALRREAKVLPWLARRLTVQIPQPEFHEAQNADLLGFVTYPVVPGEAVTRQCFLAMTQSEREHCYAHVAQFLHELHAAPSHFL